MKPALQSPEFTSATAPNAPPLHIAQDLADKIVAAINALPETISDHGRGLAVEVLASVISELVRQSGACPRKAMQRCLDIFTSHWPTVGDREAGEAWDFECFCEDESEVN